MSKAALQEWLGLGNYLPLTGGTLTGRITVTGESKFYNDTFTDPWDGTICAIKATGNIATTGIIKANEVMVGDGCTLKYDSTNKCINFVFS